MQTVPFTAEQFFGVFAAYNDAVWPFQFLLALWAAAVAVVAWRRPDLATRAVPGLLAIVWIWSGVAYHLVQFTRVNPAAYLFGGLFVVQGLLFGRAAARGDLRFASRHDALWMVGATGILYALVVYPLIGFALGQRYPDGPTFGAPCPVSIFTFGVLLWTHRSMPLHLLVIPSLWSLLAAPAAIRWGVLEDIAMPLIAIVAVVLLVVRNRRAGGGSRHAMPSPSTVSTSEAPRNRHVSHLSGRTPG